MRDALVASIIPKSEFSFRHANHGICRTPGAHLRTNWLVLRPLFYNIYQFCYINRYSGAGTHSPRLENKKWNAHNFLEKLKMNIFFLAILVALDKTRHLRKVAAPFRKNKVMHRMLNIDTFYILAACGRRARACMQIRILHSTVLGTNCKMRHALSHLLDPETQFWLHQHDCVHKGLYPGYLRQSFRVSMAMQVRFCTLH